MLCYIWSSVYEFTHTYRQTDRHGSWNSGFCYEADSHNNSIAFMDALLRRDNQLSSIVYPKPTHIHRYLPYDSHHPPAHKRAVVKSLMDRALWHADFQPPRKIERKKHSAMSYLLYKITATLNASSLKHHNREHIQKLHAENTEVKAPCPTLKGPPNQSNDYWTNTKWRLLWNLLT